MANNVLTMDEDELATATSGFDRCASDIGSTGEGVPGAFSSATSVGLLNKSVSQITQQITAIASSLSNVSGIVKKHSAQMFEYDRTMAKMAEDIEIPQDFLANNSMEVNEYNVTLLGKIDGKSVNRGSEAKEFNEIDDSTVAAEGLVNIKKDDTQKQEYDSSSIIGKSVLGNISGNQTQAQNYDDSSSVSRGNMENINKNQTEQQTYDDSSIVNKSNLSNISGDQTKEQTYDASSSVNKSNLANISGNQTEQQRLDESTTIGKSMLGNINQNSNTEQKEYDASSTVASKNLEDLNKNKGSQSQVDLMMNPNLTSTVAFNQMVATTAEDKDKKEEEIVRVNTDTKK